MFQSNSGKSRTVLRSMLLLWAFCLSACSVEAILEPANDRPFRFKRDSVAFDNLLESKPPPPGTPGTPEDRYTLHCFVLTRSARQFFQFARFDSSKRRLNDDGYRKLIQQVIAHDPSEPTATREQRIVIPGYKSLYSFSADKENLLKDELGSAAESFFQRGNWRMVFPFSHDHQEETALSMLAEIKRNRPPVVHLATFPVITINHAVLLYGAAETKSAIRFLVYDPNDASTPANLIYDRDKRSFIFPKNKYFAGGEVDAYEIYKSAGY
jgi:hypothetical protein